ncbi:hypothetical protein Misp01_68450 [Microtetraspora sp. NBRC 13810]|uniref:helix-turn-helix transcriptional regulator n=1 Tax=Microtetraspora sp. NBRC 13810 TaxID=3030990 RepID=UPI0024A479AA|nr:helix-turn-helix transcriptional regulator [Microtetraspora sp. NBRC 13810]GLW11717.1 hypothetical protein Misp01_68450 [Microtetraspora sp. NBRC 13810]
MTPLRCRIGRQPPTVAHYSRGATFGPRTLVDFELVWMVTGTARWRRLDVPDERELAPGDLLLVRPGMRDEFAWDARSPCAHGYVHVSISPEVDTGGWPLVRPTAAPSPLAGLLSYLLWLADEGGTGSRDRIEEVLGTLIGIFVRGPLPERRDRPEPAALAAALDWVRATWAAGGMRGVAVDELAAAALVSRTHISRLFTRHFGHPPAAALELVRLARARTLLLRSNMTVTVVARDCGFTDPLHFSRRFRAAFGRSPREFRSAHQAGEPPDPPGLRSLLRRLS